jgi:hypothetical protein
MTEEIKDIEFIEREWVGTEWAGEDTELLHFRVNGEDVDVAIACPSRVKRKETSPITVIWNGAIDFEGTFKEFKEEYPELAKEVKAISYYL